MVKQMKVYMLFIYIIHMECDDIMLTHHLQLDFVCDFTCVINENLIVHVGCILVLITN